MSSVSLGGVAANIVFENDTVVVATAGNGLITGNAVDVVLVGGTGAVTRLTNGWTFVDGGRIGAIQPARGQLGTRVTIFGLDLLSAGSEITQVTLKGVNVMEIVSQSSVQVVVRAGKSTSFGTGDVVLLLDTGAKVSLTNGFTYEAPSNITGVSPGQGQVGTVVSISGSLLLGNNPISGSSIVNVTLAGAPATVLFGNGSVVVVVASSNGAGSGDVVVVASSGAIASLTNGFQYNAVGNVSSISPASGQVGTRVTIEGSRLLGGGSSATSVKLNNVEALQIISSNNSMVVVIAGHRNSNGLVSVVLVSNTGATVVGVDKFTYLGAGVISSVVPSDGQGGTVVVIRGNGLLGGGSSFVNVTLKGIEVLEILGANDSYIRVRAGFSGGVTGVGNVTLRSDTGATVIAANQWTYNTGSVVVSATPSSGQVGTVVSIAGSNLLGVTGGSYIQQVLLAGVEAEIVNGSSATEIVVVARGSFGGAAGTGSIVVVADSGAQASLVGGWSYLKEGNMTSVSPAYGQIGTIVTIRGERLLGGGSSVASVTLAGISVSSIVRGNNSEIVVVAAAGGNMSSAGDVVVVANSGARVVKSSSWQYRGAGVVTQVTPNVGQLQTNVRIEGNSLRGHGSAVVSVTLANEATSIVSQSDNVVEVISLGSSTAKTGDVVVRADTGAFATLTNGWTFQEIGNITNVEPSSGQYGTRVTISGGRLRGSGNAVVKVELGGRVASILNESDSQVVVRAAAGPGAQTIGNVVLTADTGAIVTLVNGWTYLQPGSILSVVPSSGRVGTRVTIFGSLCGGGSQIVSVLLADFEANITSDPLNCDSVIVNARDYGANVLGSVTVISDTSSIVSAANRWKYIAEGQITSVSPQAGQGGDRGRAGIPAAARRREGAWQPADTRTLAD